MGESLKPEANQPLSPTKMPASSSIAEQGGTAASDRDALRPGASYGEAHIFDTSVTIPVSNQEDMVQKKDQLCVHWTQNPMVNNPT